MTVRYFYALGVMLLASHLFGQRQVSFPLQTQPGEMHPIEIQADLYGSGVRGVVLAHGGPFHKESGKKQAQILANAGFLVLAVGFRGDAFNPDGSPGSFGSTAKNAADVLAAVSHLYGVGARTIYAVGRAWVETPSERRIQDLQRVLSPVSSS